MASLNLILQVHIFLDLVGSFLMPKAKTSIKQMTEKTIRKKARTG
jgi:hypothetical protein